MIKNLNPFKKIAVLEFNLEYLNNNLIVDESYKLALVVFRYKNSVPGQLLLRVNNGVVEIPDIQEIVKKFYEALWEIFSKKESVDYSPLVSVVVCTHNRTGELINCLESLKNLRYSKKEVIIVDNAPVNEETKKLVSAYKNYIYINENRKGLDIARNRGIKEARGEIIAFTDDDAVVDSFWLDAIVQQFKYPLVAAVTGITMPLQLETKAQIIFEQTNGFNRGFLKKEYTFNNIRPLAAGRTGAGVNMAVRKEYLSTIGLFDEALDGGTLTLSGGDQEFLCRTLIKGYKIIYTPEALVWHKHRREMNNLRKTIYGYGVGVFAWWTKIIFKEKEITSIIPSIIWFFLHYFLNLFKSLLRRPGVLPFRLTVVEFLGTLRGPFAYFKAKKI